LRGSPGFSYEEPQLSSGGGKKKQEEAVSCCGRNNNERTSRSLAGRANNNKTWGEEKNNCTREKESYKVETPICPWLAESIQGECVPCLVEWKNHGELAIGRVQGKAGEGLHTGES